MKKIVLFSSLSLFFSYCSFSQNVGIGTTTPNTSAMLDVQSTNKGLLPPRMTTLQRDAISSPTPGLIIFNTDTQSLEVFTNTGWFAIKKTNTPIEKLLGGFNYEGNCSIQKTTDGGYIIAGLSTSSATFDVTGTNHGAIDYWIIKLDALGAIVWNKLLGGTAYEYATGIQQTTDGGYIVAGYSTSSANGDVTGTNHGVLHFDDYWIVKLNATGNITWNKLLGGTGDEDAKSIQQTTDGGYIVAGYSSTSANGDVTGTNHGFDDCWIVKLDANGNILWNKLLGGNNAEMINSIQQTADGGYIAAGGSASSANGNVTATNHGGSDVWIIKLDAVGNITWNKLFGGNLSDNATVIRQTTDGGFIVAGYSTSSANGDVTATNHGNNDYWILKLDATGNISWNKLLGGVSDEQASDIQQTVDGGYVVAGYSQSSANGDVTGVSHGNSDYWIVKLDATGNISWNKLLGGFGIELNPKIQLTTEGGYIVAGSSSSSASGDIKGVNHGDADYWIVKLNSAGNIIQQ
jgi:hypothetical protein